MGYDLNKFVDVQDLPNHLRCLICNLVLAEPLQSPCDHYFCNQCITIHLQSTSHCPHYEEDSVSVKSDKKKSPLRKMSFRKIIGKSPKDKFPSLKLSDLKPLPDSVLAELNALKVLCDFSLNGCKESLTLDKLNAHVKQCKFIDSKTNEQMSLENKEQQPNSIQPAPETVQTTTNQPGETSADPELDLEIEQTRVESSESPNSDLNSEPVMDSEKSAEKRKDSESKSVNGEVKLVSEEEAGSDDFVVIPKAGGTSSTKSTESVQTNNSEPALLSSKENVNKEEDGAEKKKKKKKKKKNANKTEADAVSLKDGESGSPSEVSGGSKTQSKESLVESEEVKRALREAETKSENLRTINSQLLGQIKKLKEEREEITKKLESQLGSDEADALKAKVQLLEQENRQQALKIIQLLDNNDAMNKYIISLREEQSCLKEQFNAALSKFSETVNRVKTCRQAN